MKQQVVCPVLVGRDDQETGRYEGMNIQVSGIRLRPATMPRTGTGSSKISTPLAM